VATDVVGNQATNSITLIVNALPTIAITNPADGAGLIAPATFSLQATASDLDGEVTQIQFFRGTTSLGVTTTNPASLLVKGLEVGNYTFTAVARDNLGGTASDNVNLLVKNRPTITFATPAAGARLTNAVTSITGKAADSVRVARVDYSANAAPFAPATGTTNWNVPIALSPGTNIVRVRSVDPFGNFSLTNTRSFFQVVMSALTLSVSGTGTVSGATNAQVLEVGRGYQLTATAGAGFLFSNWTGTASSAAPTLRFLMESNMALQANFVPNPFLRVSGQFNGLFYETNEVRHGSSGDFKLLVTTSGRYTGSLRLGGRRYAAAGKLDLEGKATNVIIRLGTNSLTVHWAVDLHGLDQLTGTVSDGQWLASLLGDRAIFNAATNPAPLAARYTLVLPGSDPTNSPGDGWGTLRVTTSGLGVFAGSVADGTRLTRSVPVSKNGAWPLYVPLYALHGSLLGWVQFDTNAPSDDLTGLVDWMKPSFPTARFYPGGLTNQTTLTGSRYLAPVTTTNRVLDLTNAVLVLNGGNLSQNCTNEIVLAANNRVTNASPNKLSVALSLGNGLFKGTFTDTNVSRTVNFSGALLQKSSRGAGCFLGTNLSGRVLLQGQP
jgi:hypothetical protein